MLAANHNHLTMAKKLIALGAKMNAQNNVGNTALMIAVQNKNFSIVELLLSHDAERGLKNVNGIHAESLAKSMDSKKLIDLFQHSDNSVFDLITW
ncbi:MAG: ankyrin repeat domain-containing protein [Methylococcales bacterium]|jgi:ankyrin repeat protein|nr:ankyrin repeat domain-containing protein [Methylococcales bacterium]MBT7442372.1 ankyrin repeat domain-containing protein [Methylococcales bacterium]